MERTEGQKTTGEAAYEGYRKVSGGKSIVTGAAIPEWDGLDDRIKTCWQAAADAAVTHARSLHPGPGF